MKVVVIGAGLIGVTTAYFLKRRGCDVTVFERRDGPAKETSFANGGLLTAGMSEPWNTPGCWRTILASFVRSDSALRVPLKMLPELLPWGVQFLRNSNVELFDRNTCCNARLSLYSLALMRALRQDLVFDYGFRASGSIKLYRDNSALTKALTAAERLRKCGLRFEGLSGAGVMALEPALAPIASQLAGAVHFEDDESGDAYRFCLALAEAAKKLGVEFRFGTSITSIRSKADAVTSIQAADESLVADHFVVAAAGYSTQLLKPLGINLPMKPVKGYSLSFHDVNTGAAPRISIVDDSMHAALVSVDGALRVAGTAEFCGFDLTLSETRIKNLATMVSRILPGAGIDMRSARPWCGLRAMSSDGVPIIGGTPFQNLWVNTGHGHLGWTMAAGSAQLLTDLVMRAAPELDATLYGLARFRPEVGNEDV